MDEENRYGDIDALTNKTNDMYQNAFNQQQDIINKQTGLNVDELERNKKEVQEEADKANKALYSEYQKQVNPYGYNAEVLASQGLGNSGVSESSRTSMYNTYQNNRTNTINTATKAKADFDAQIARARTNGDIQLAQSALNLYNQQIENLYTQYNLRYQKDRDTVSDNQWNKEYQRQLDRDAVSDSQWNKQWQYQQDRDAISDSQWEKEYQRQLNRDAISDEQWNKQWNYSTSKSSSGSGRSGRSSSSNYLVGDTGSNGLMVSDDLYKELTDKLVGSNSSNLRMDERTKNAYNALLDSPVSSVAINKLLLGRG